MRKKLIAAILVSAMAVGMISGCGTGGSDSEAEKIEVPTEPFGDTIKYDPSVEINDGKDITVELWEWGSDDLFQEIIDGYTAIHPNVTIKLVNNPWEDYWTKLPLALDGENGPALFNVHNSYHENMINYMAPLEIPIEDLEADFTGVNAHVIDGEVYYIDYGMMTGAVYYNKDMWEAAGLTEEDIPKTWDEFIDVAQKLTKFDEDGNMIQAGYNYNNYFNSTVIGLNYQFGDNLFSADGKESLVDGKGMKEATSFLIDLYEKYRVGDKDFGTNYDQSFYQGQSAIVFAWGFFVGNLATNAPDINYGTFEIPTQDGDTPYAYYRYNGESTPGINKNATDAQKEVAQDFIRFYLASDNVQIKLSQDGGLIPAKSSLMDAPELADTPIVKTVGDHIDRYIWPGAMPSTVENNLKIAGEDILYNGKEIDDALKTAADTIDIDLANADFTSSESLYAYYED